jgi:hypothetical protein
MLKQLETNWCKKRIAMLYFRFQLNDSTEYDPLWFTCRRKSPKKKKKVHRMGRLPCGGKILRFFFSINKLSHHLDRAWASNCRL